MSNKLSEATINAILSYLWGRDIQANGLYNLVMVELNQPKENNNEEISAEADRG